MQSYPVDIYSIKKCGIEEWHKNFFWPVSILEYEKLCSDIDKMVDKIICEASAEVRDALLVLYGSLTVGISLLIHHQLVINRYRAKDHTIQYHVDREPQPTIGMLSSSEYWDILINEKPITNLVRKPLPNEPTIIKIILDSLRSIKTNVIENGLLEYTKSLLLQKECILYAESPSNYLREYAKNSGKMMRNVSQSSFLASTVNMDNYTREIKSSISAYIRGIKEISTMHKASLSDQHISELFGLFENDVHKIINVIETIKRKLSKSTHRTTFMFMRTGNLFIRSLGISCNKTGNQAIAVTHGNYFGIFDNNRVSKILFGCTDYFVPPSKGSAHLFSESIKKYINPLGKLVKVLPAIKTLSSSQLIEEQSKSKLPRAIQNVMIIEDGLVPHFQPWPFYLDFNLRKALMLRKKMNGIKLILKKHPDRLAESEGVYEGYYDELLSSPFEQVREKADAYIFSHIGTTAFGFALFTSKPIIVFEHNLENLLESVRGPLLGRCRVIRSWYNHDGRIMFDEDSLVAALKKKPEIPDNEFVKSFMLT